MKISGKKKRPFVAIRFAASLDGKIATRRLNSRWITNEESRVFERKLRSTYQAIVIGSGTLLKDNPHLGTRIKGKKDPLRVILDTKLKIPINSQVLRDGNVLVATTDKSSKKKKKILEKRGITILSFAGKKISLQKLLSELAERKVISVLVEGGGKVLGDFVDKKLVDKVYAFYGPIIIGGERAVNAVRGRGAETIKDALHLKELSFRRFGDNFMVSGYVKR